MAGRRGSAKKTVKKRVAKSVDRIEEEEPPAWAAELAANRKTHLSIARAKRALKEAEAIAEDLLDGVLEARGLLEAASILSARGLVRDADVLFALRLCEGTCVDPRLEILKRLLDLYGEFDDLNGAPSIKALEVPASVPESESESESEWE